MVTKVEEDGNLYIFQCPYEDCNGYITVAKKELNCKIFRHGVLKRSFQQMGPHDAKNICDSLYSNKEIYGCGRPFRFVSNHSGNHIEKCDYI